MKLSSLLALSEILVASVAALFVLALVPRVALWISFVAFMLIGLHLLLRWHRLQRSRQYVR